MDREILKQRIDNNKQVIVVYDNYGEAGIDWDARSLEDVRALLKCALNYIENEIVENEIVEKERKGSTGSGRLGEETIEQIKEYN